MATCVFSIWLIWPWKGPNKVMICCHQATTIPKWKHPMPRVPPSARRSLPVLFNAGSLMVKVTGLRPQTKRPSEGLLNSFVFFCLKLLNNNTAFIWSKQKSTATNGNRFQWLTLVPDLVPRSGIFSSDMAETFRRWGRRFSQWGDGCVTVKHMVTCDRWHLKVWKNLSIDHFLITDEFWCFILKLLVATSLNFTTAQRTSQVWGRHRDIVLGSKAVPVVRTWAVFLASCPVPSLDLINVKVQTCHTLLALCLRIK